jgi:branched-subunit amino acid ABC-type transport system permease component
MPDWLIIRTFWDLTVTGLALGSIYALVALGYTLVYGVLRLINFGGHIRIAACFFAVPEHSIA